MTTRPDTGVLAFLRDRIGWEKVVSLLAAHRAPRRGYVFYLGGVTLFLFLLEVASGSLLLLHYQPDPATAHASIVRITGEIPYGDLVRGVHLWAGDLFMACLLAHMFTVVIRRSHAPPHELTWLSGQGALVLGVGLAFTGAILPWSERAYTDARMGSELCGYVPLIGAALRRFMRGGDEVTAATLGHAFGFHVAVLPAALTVIVLLHVALLANRPALTPERARAEGETIPLYPDFLVRQAVAWTFALVVVMTLALFVDRPLGAAADPRVASSEGSPPWYFLPVHQLVRSAPRDLLGVDGARFLVGAACAAGVLVVALPFLDRRGSRATAWAAWVVLLVLCLLGARALA